MFFFSFTFLKCLSILLPCFPFPLHLPFCLSFFPSPLSSFQLFTSPSFFSSRLPVSLTDSNDEGKRKGGAGREGRVDGREKNTIIFLTALRLSSCSFVFCLMWRFTFLFLILEQADTGAPRPVYTQTDWQCLSVCLSLAVNLFYLKRKSSN